MASTPILPVSKPRKPRAQNGTISTKHTVTLSFDGKYLDLYSALKQMAEDDDRPLPVYIVRLLSEDMNSLKPA